MPCCPGAAGTACDEVNSPPRVPSASGLLVLPSCVCSLCLVYAYHPQSSSAQSSAVTDCVGHESQGTLRHLGARDATQPSQTIRVQIS
eukprot:scaffold227836_cov32-Tisochrysis_lutea.AAC.2